MVLASIHNLGPQSESLYEPFQAFSPEPSLDELSEENNALSGYTIKLNSSEGEELATLWPEKRQSSEIPPPKEDLYSDISSQLTLLDTSWHPLIQQHSSDQAEEQDEWFLVPKDDPEEGEPKISALTEQQRDEKFFEKFVTELYGPKGVSIKDRYWFFRPYQNCFVGRECVDWLVANKYATERQTAVTVGQNLLRLGYIEHVTQSYDFLDGYYLYHFMDKGIQSNGIQTPYQMSPCVSPRDSEISTSNSSTRSFHSSASSPRSNPNSPRSSPSPRDEASLRSSTPKPHPKKTLSTSGQTHRPKKPNQLRDPRASGSDHELESPKAVVCRICEETIPTRSIEEHTLYCMIASKCDQVSQGCDVNLEKLRDCIIHKALPEDKNLQTMIKICEQAKNVCYDLLEEGIQQLETLSEEIEGLINGSTCPAVSAFGNKLIKILSQKTASLREYTTVVQSQPITGSSNRADNSLFSFFSKFSRSSQKAPQKRLALPDGTSSPRRDNANIRDFEIVSPLSSGGFGRVYLAKKKATGDQYAIKVIKKSHLDQKNIDAITERNAMAFANKPFVCNLYYAFQSRELLFLVMEYIPGGDLSSLLTKLGQFSERTSQHYLAEIVLILEYIHSIGIIHKDIKPSNFLLTSEGHLKITDFGLSKITYHIGQPAEEPKTLPDPLLDLVSEATPDSTKSVAHRGVIGTPDYLSPEALLKHKSEHLEAVDWWAVGVMAFEFLTGVPPFTDLSPQAIFQNILNRDMLAWPEEEEYSPQSQDFVDQMLQLDPKDRLGTAGAKEIKNWHVMLFDLRVKQLPFSVLAQPKSELEQNHEFFAGLDWATVWNASLEDLQISSSCLMPDPDRLHSDSSNSSGISNLDITDLTVSTEIPNFSFKNLHYLKEKNKQLLIDDLSRSGGS